MKIIVIVHIFYPEMWEELKECLKNISLPYDLIATFVEKHPDIEKDIVDFKHDAKIMHCENRGYDVGPFMQALKSVDLDRYDFLIKLHSKRDISVSCWQNEFPYPPEVKRLRADKWRKILFSFCSSKEIFRKCISAFSGNEKLGMIGNRELFYEVNKEMNGIVEHGSIQFLEKMDMLLDSFRFVGGTMFIVRAALFKCLQQMQVDFTITHRSDSESNAHIMERVFGGVVYGQGYCIDDCFSGTLFRGTMYKKIYPVLKFFFQKKITASGNLLIKVCKIPVWRSSAR